MHSVKIRIDIEGNIVSEVCRLRDVRIKVLRCVPNRDGGGKSLLRIDTNGSVTEDDVVKWFKESNPAIEMSCSPISPGRFMAIVSNPSCRTCQIFSRSNCLLDSGQVMENGLVTWNILSPDQDSLRGFIKDLRTDGAKVELMKVKRLCPLTELTIEQDAMVRLAYSLGYYDIPKRITLEELAAKNEISKSTMNLILRRAQRKILSKYIGTN